MHGPICIFRANLTPFPLKSPVNYAHWATGEPSETGETGEKFVELDLRGGIDALKKTASYNGGEMDGSGTQVSPGRVCHLDR